MTSVYHLKNRLNAETLEDKAAISTSWTTIFTLAESIKNAVKLRQWNNALAVNQLREQHIDQHFIQFPIANNTQYFYQSRLSQLFSLQNELTALLKENRSSHLKLVK